MSRESVAMTESRICLPVLAWLAMVTGLLPGMVLAAGLPFEVSYTEAATPGETVRVRLASKEASEAKSVIFPGGPEVPFDDSGEAILRVPEETPVCSNLDIAVITRNGERHPLPAIAVVPESSQFGRTELVTGLAPIASPEGGPVVLPMRVPAPYRINGWPEISKQPFLDGPWPADGGFFLRVIDPERPGVYSSPIWFSPLIGREETYADYRFDANSRRLVDRWKRMPSREAGEAIRPLDNGLPVLRLPARKSIQFDADDLPTGPVTLSLWIDPMNRGKEQVIRASTMLTLGIDGEGRLHARRSDDARSDCRATAAEPLQPGVWQHVAAVFDGKKLIIYQNGKATGSVPCSGRKSSSRELYEKLGTANDGRAPFIGMIGAYAVYNRALPASIVSKLATAFDNSFPADPTSTPQ